MNMPGTGHGIETARALPCLDTGIHLNITWGKPLCAREEVPTLVDEQGTFLTKRRFAIRWLAGRINPVHLEHEWTCQIERFLAARLPLYHLNVHQHIHALPGVMKTAQQLAQRHGVPFLRQPLEKPSRTFSAVAIRVGLALGRSGYQATTRSADHFVGIAVTGFLGDRALHDLIMRLKPGVTEFMCHPGRCDESLRGMSRLIAQRELEMKALASPMAKTWLAAAGAQLTNYSALAAVCACRSEGGTP